VTGGWDGELIGPPVVRVERGRDACTASVAGAQPAETEAPARQADYLDYDIS
jgi:hypothetical protein